MNTQKLTELIRFILTVSSQDEDWRCRELGPIHVIKYVYLADMYYAAENGGKTFTGTAWKFYHFGPWDLELYQEIPNAVKAIGGDIRTFESEHEKDGVRFSLTDDTLQHNDTQLPNSIIHLLRRDIQNFGSATNDLLHYVYTTPPITNATPGEDLKFTHKIFPDKQSIKKECGSPLTAKGKKRKKKHIESVKKKIAQKREENKKRRIKPRPPRYDDVFFQGMMELDQGFENPQIKDQKGIIRVNPNVWGGDWRKNRDLP